MTSSHQPLKSRVFSEWSHKRTSEIWSMVGIGVPLLAWRWNEPRGKKCRQLLDAENGLPLRASKGRGLQSSNPKELKLANKNDHGNRFSSKSPDENSVQSMPWLRSCKSLGRESSHTTTDFIPRGPPVTDIYPFVRRGNWGAKWGVRHPRSWSRMRSLLCRLCPASLPHIIQRAHMSPQFPHLNVDMSGEHCGPTWSEVNTADPGLWDVSLVRRGSGFLQPLCLYHLNGSSTPSLLSSLVF